MHACMYFCLYLFMLVFMHIYELMGGNLPCSIWVRSFVPVSTTMFCRDHRIMDHRCGQDGVGRVRTRGVFGIRFRIRKGLGRVRD